MDKASKMGLASLAAGEGGGFCWEVGGGGSMLHKRSEAD